MTLQNILTGEIVHAEWSTEHPASSYGQPVLVTDSGEAIDEWYYARIDREPPALLSEAR